MRQNQYNRHSSSMSTLIYGHVSNYGGISPWQHIICVRDTLDKGGQADTHKTHYVSKLMDSYKLHRMGRFQARKLAQNQRNHIAGWIRQTVGEKYNVDK